MANHSIKQEIKTRLSPLLNLPAVNRLRGVPMPDYTGDAAQAAIARMVVEGGRLIARVGETEGRAAAWYLRERLGRNEPRAAYEPLNRERLKSLAGYFPTTDTGIDVLAALYVQTIAEVDLYAAWTPHDGILCPPKARVCRLRDLDPFFTDVRWTRALAGRRVTVVSPFVATIQSQWPKRAALFDVETMPECDLKLVQAPQTQCEVDVEGKDWIDNLTMLDGAVAATRPEVVIIGAGAYGLPLGAFAKRRGTTAIVLGGSTQLLFGIMGNRWMLFPEYRALLNSEWTRPGEEERPPGFEKFETSGGAYW
jgi:hypothetical protein